MKYNLKLTIIDNFWNKVLFTSDCWKWQRGKNIDGNRRCGICHKNGCNIRNKKYKLKQQKEIGVDTCLVQ